MLVGLIVRTKLKRPNVLEAPISSLKKSKPLRPEEEPYEPPGINDMIAGEPDTPSPITTPKPSAGSATEPLLNSEGTYALVNN